MNKNIITKKKEFKKNRNYYIIKFIGSLNKSLSINILYKYKEN